MIEFKDGLARDGVTYVVEMVDHWEPFSIGWIEPVTFQKLRSGDKCRVEILPPGVEKRPTEEDQVAKWATDAKTIIDGQTKEKKDAHAKEVRETVDSFPDSAGVTLYKMIAGRT